MNVFPKWYLCLCFPALLSVFASPMYLFGGLRLFGFTESKFLGILYFLLQNLIWLAPVVLFFVSLHIFAQGYEKSGVALAVLNLCLMAGSFGVVMI